MKSEDDVSFLDMSRLQSGLKELGLSATERQLEQLDLFAEMLFKWNKTYNLTAISAKEDVLTHHILDSLSVISLFKSEAMDGARILDVGSGGGLPAIPLAIMCPSFSISMVDTVGKKAAFLTQCCVSLRLQNARAFHARVENLKGEKYDVITSRAFASLSLFTDLTKHLLKEDGCWLALKGPGVSKEVMELSADICVVENFDVQVPYLGEKRCLVKMKIRESCTQK